MVSSDQVVRFSESERSPLSIRASALVFCDPRSQQLQQQLEQLAPTGLPILIEGEMGTGKELLARRLHQASERAGLFVSVNCSGLRKSLADAELFGYVAGAFGGMPSSRAGWVGSATGGSLYLDEVADLSLPMQHKLLQALKEQQVVRVGAQRATAIDVRLIAATSIDLQQAVVAGKFDAELLAYLAQGPLQLPPLRERPKDVMPLAEYFLAHYAQRLELPLPHISDAAQALLEGYAWPGNTRELENVIHFALLVCGAQIEPAHLRFCSLAG